jgi:hypothetical protein
MTKLFSETTNGANCQSGFRSFFEKKKHSFEKNRNRVGKYIFLNFQRFGCKSRKRSPFYESVADGNFQKKIRSNAKLLT